MKNTFNLTDLVELSGENLETVLHWIYICCCKSMLPLSNDLDINFVNLDYCKSIHFNINHGIYEFNDDEVKHILQNVGGVELSLRLQQEILSLLKNYQRNNSTINCSI